MTSRRTSFVREAIILAAGNGDRFQDGFPHSKLLTPIAGIPLLARTLTSAWEAGISDAHVVLGYDAEAVRALAAEASPLELRVYFHLNRDWHHENGVSVLTARPFVDERPFALMMGDHIFPAEVLSRLIRTPRRRGETLLCVDREPADPEAAAEATKVRLEGDHVSAIGKKLAPYDALDTGLFVCDPSVFAALERSCAAGDSTLSGGIARLASERRVRGVDIGDGRWCDIDTVADVSIAEALVELAFRT
jgi:1L-myo-inositol 1-phosphate cytidylyltransferase